MRRYGLFVLVFMFVISFSSSNVLGSRGEIALVTVGESVDGQRRGGVAELFLEIRPGSGRVFIDSLPFTREDTQVSVRFAKNVACSFLEMDCSDIDFFYTINIGSSSVGGPSAGAAIAVLTIGVLSGDSIDDSVVVTGTINSGGIIGPVSGLEEKAIAARDKGFSKFLVPKRSILIDKTLAGIDNESIGEDDLNISSRDNITVFYADSLVVEGIEIVTVSTLEEVLFEFTGRSFPDYSYEISVPEQYQRIMSDVSNTLCERSETIIASLPASVFDQNSSVLKNALNSLELGRNASVSSDYYSAASFCFTANTALRSLEFDSYSDEFLEDLARDISNNITSFLDDINNRDLKTLSDLETYIIVKERLLEAKSFFDDDSYFNNLGYVYERFFSAIAWSSFFEFDGKEVVLDDAHLENVCVAKIAEAEERLSYIDFLTGIIFDRSDLNAAKRVHEEGDYAFCVFSATKVKADANAIILSMSLSRDKVTDLINDQLTFARMQINKQGDNFPILGYSYYNYATTLKETNPRLSMVFAEYASEFSNLNMYFPLENYDSFDFDFDSYEPFSLGFLVGFSFGLVLVLFLMLVFRLFRVQGKKRRVEKKFKQFKSKKYKPRKTKELAYDSLPGKKR